MNNMNIINDMDDMDDMNNIIGYSKYKHYILTIKPNDFYHRNKTITNDKCVYSSSNYIVLVIEDILGNHYDNIANKYYEINKIYKNNIRYNLIKEIAFNKDFIKNKEYLLFGNEYSNYYTSYSSNGYIIEEFFHINGKKNGLYKKYFCFNGYNMNNSIEIEAYYVNNKLHGEYKEYYNNNKIKEICYYNNGFRHGNFRRYDEDGNITCNYIFNNGMQIK